MALRQRANAASLGERQQVLKGEALIAFLWIIGAMGVAYAAKLSGRTPFLWLLLGIVLTPIGGGLLLSAANRRGWIMRL